MFLEAIRITRHITEKKLHVLSKLNKVRILHKSFMLKLIIIVIQFELC